MTNQVRNTDKQATKSAATTDSYITTTTTSSSKATDPGVLLDPAALEEIRQAYESVLGPLNSVKAYDIEHAIHAGLQTSAILDAIDQTAMAMNPTHYYLRAILRRYISDQIFTRERAERLRDIRRMAREARIESRWVAWYESPCGHDIG